MLSKRLLPVLCLGLLIVATCSCGVVGPVGALIGGTIALSGGGGGGKPPPASPVAVSLGPDTPPPASIQYNAADTLVLQFMLTNNSAVDIDISSIALTARGTVNDADDISAVKLYIDQNQDGLVDGGDTPIGGNQTFSSDNGTATFTFAASTVTQGTSELYLAVANLSVGTADHNENFSFNVAQGLDISAQETLSLNPVTVGGAASGSFFTILGVPQVELDEGSNNPADGGVFEGATDVVMLQMRVTAGSLQSVTITSATFTASGTLNDASAITSVALYRDVNNNGALDAIDSLIDPATKTYSFDNGTVTFNFSRTINQGQTDHWLVVYDLDTPLTPNDTFQVRLVQNTDIAHDATFAHGAPVNGAVKHIQGIGSITDVSSVSPPPDSSVPFTGEWPILHLRFTTGPNEPVDITSIVLSHSASATASVAADVSEVRLYHDLNKNGRYDCYADILLDTATYSGNQVTLSSFTLPCSASDTTHALIQYVMKAAESEPSGRTHQVTLDPATDVVARGHDTSQPITAAGGLVTGPTMTVMRDTWVSVSAGGPTSRYEQTAVTDGTNVYIWGGRSGATYYQTGAIYHPLENTWTAISTTGAPSGRNLHCAVWTGTKMFIWGGYNSASAYLGDGGLYDPATDTWQTISSANAPTSRITAVAAWTGSRVVVWGGYNGTLTPPDNYINSGGVYDPGTDTWTATNLSGAPTGRRYFSGDWNGTGMIVWGGSDPTYLNDGGIYYPTTNSWSGVPTAGAPTGRRDHTAVWCTNRFIVWGGYDGSYLATGAYYQGGGWTDIDTGAPGGRRWHTAVWDGKLMTVWGGQDSGSTVAQTGSRLEPATRTWTATSTAGAPSARRLHSAIWSGTGMVIWGGSTSTGITPTNTGGRYLP